MKICNKCGIEKSINEFYKDSCKRDGLTTFCKKCKLEAKNEYARKNRKTLAEKSRKYRLANIDACRERERKYSLENSDKRDARVAKFYMENPAKRKEYNSRYYAKPENKERANAYAKEYAKRMRRSCEIYKIKMNCRSRIHAALRGIGLSKKTKTFEAIGCSPEQLKMHLESKFSDGMSWDNYGEWHIDHIIPIASASNYDDVISLSHYTNLQPLWAYENLKKGARIDYRTN